ncbi:MAG TPA: amino acid permease [Sphingomicrobium sp.]|nr:amino acid permease [Sphingomicrobium sp.]
MRTSGDSAAAAVIHPPINVDPPASERQLGLTMTTALVVGNVIGAGIFLLPAVLAPFGTNAIYGWLITIAGALFLAATFAILARRIEGGPFAYVEEAFGAEIGFVVMWAYLVSIWTADAILPIAAVSNFSHIAPVLGQPIIAPASAVLILWIFLGVNATGARSAGIVQVATTLLKALPLIAILLVAAIYLGRGIPAAEQSAMPISTGAIAGAAALALFSMLGIEAATVSTDKVKDPQRTIPFASLLGPAIAGAIYLGVTWAVLYLLPANEAANSPSPFADAAQPLLGPLAGSVIALFAGISALGALNGWILCSGEIPLKLARDGVFPAWFAKTTGRGTPVRAQVVACIVATLLVVANYSKSLAGIFAFITLISVVSTLVLYTGCSAGALTLLARKRLTGALLAVCASVGLIFSLWSYWGAGLEPTLWGAALMLTGIPVWLAVRRSRRLSPATIQARAASPAAPPEPAA